jgi:hypothetical protein
MLKPPSLAPSKKFRQIGSLRRTISLKHSTIRHSP